MPGSVVDGDGRRLRYRTLAFELSGLEVPRVDRVPARRYAETEAVAFHKRVSVPHPVEGQLHNLSRR